MELLNEDDAKKLEAIEEGAKAYDVLQVVQSLSNTGIMHVLQNRDFLTKYRISPYQIIGEYDRELQLDVMSKFEDMGFSIAEKRQILATLPQSMKKNIDTSEFPQEYMTAFEIQISEDFGDIRGYGKITVDFDVDLERYRGLDKLIHINPMQVSNENRAKILQLCEICPTMDIENNLNSGQSTVEEYRDAEGWINSVLEGIKPEWTDIQKVAFIDNAIGKKISYAPEFGTEMFNENDARALWKIISSGHGVCNGITQVEKYILGRIGIEAEEVPNIKSNGRSSHGFLKLKNIELPSADGVEVIGDTILDPTWNLVAHRYRAKPENFCRSYENIRKKDIREDGTDAECHKNDEALVSATLELDEQSLRQLFASIGIADKDGQFPITKLKADSKAVDDLRLPSEEAIKRQFLLLAEYYPEFAACPNSTAAVLSGILLNNENFKFDKCVVNRVYEREDENKKLVQYVYANFPGVGKKFYVVDKSMGQFVELPQAEFEKRFECYENDLKVSKGIRPWEDSEAEKTAENLEQSSGRIVAGEGKER